jgi:BirA family biotin operon repressor/biotin-[acetyl-CoA-carboxylase] ligase
VGGILLEEKNGVILAGLGVNLAESPSAALLRADKATSAAVLSAHHLQKLLPAEVDCAAQAEAAVHSVTHKNSCASGQAKVRKEFAGSAFLSPFIVWQHLVSATILEYNHKIQKQSLPDILAGCNQLLAWKGRYVNLTEADGASISGYCQGLGKNGGLLLRCADGRESEYFSGSLSLAAARSHAAPEALPG